jgi:hypothetical protein
MSDVEILIAILTFIVGCFCGSRYKETEFGYRLNRIRSDVDSLKDKIRRLESPHSELLSPPTVEYRK